MLAIGTATSRHRRVASPGEVVAVPAKSEPAGRTFVCSVLFVQALEYARKPVAEQLQIKERIHRHLSLAIRDMAPADRIVLETSDGVAISFLGEAEGALVVALRLTDALAREPKQVAPVPVRAGINLGPVRLARDVNGQPNLVGDGIDVAQRVTSFAQPGQVLVSRSYHDVIARDSEEYAELFTYRGSRTDPHIREHEIYELEPITAALRQRVEKRRRTRRHRLPGAGSASASRFLARRGLALGVLAASTLAFVSALLLVVWSGPEPAPASTPVPQMAKQLDASAAPTPRAAPGAPLDRASGAGHTLPLVQAEAGKPHEPAAARREAPRAPPAKSGFLPRAVAKGSDHSEPNRAPPVPDSSAGASAKAPAAAVTTTAAELAPPPHAHEPTALVVLAISPWGEVYVNGKAMGVSPPLNDLELPRGKYRIEVRNGGFKPFRADYELGSNQTVRIKHKFKQPR